MMSDAIKAFAKQFEFKPAIENEENLQTKENFVVVGMGGSHLAADIAKNIQPDLKLHIRSDYGLPEMSEEDLQNSLIICSSYSGNTEEVVEAYNQAQEKGLAIAVVCVGGKLLELAKQDGNPYVQMPDTGIQPRSALGFSLLAILRVMGLDSLIEKAGLLSTSLKPEELEERGKELAERAKDKVPVIYTSRANFSIAYNWKIKLNETGKIPAFYNVLPELNHNEMNGFDAQDSSRHLSEDFYFIFLHDNTDHPKIQKRMEVVQKLYQDRDLKFEVVDLEGDIFTKIFISLIIADWFAVHTAEIYGLESEQVPMIEEFKKLIA